MSIENQETNNDSVSRKSNENMEEKGAFSDSRYFIARHDDAIYQLNEYYAQKEPLAEFDKRKQPDSDLTQEGIEHAYAEAAKFFSDFDPDKDEMVFVSSALTRARQTATIFLEVATQLGFATKVLARNPENDNDDLSLMSLEEFEEKTSEDPKKIRTTHRNRGSIPNSLYDQQGGPEIRTLKSLSLDNIRQQFMEFIYHQDNYINNVEHPDSLSPEYREAWRQAREVIEADNKGSWGENFLAYSKEISEMLHNYRSEHNLSEEELPVPHTVEDMYHNNFRNTLRLMSRYDEAIDEHEANHPEGKKLRVVAFSHENSLLYFLDKEFDKTGVDKGKAIGFNISRGEDGLEHFTACLPDNPQEPKEIAFPDKE